jgi:hypothetical protein
LIEQASAGASSGRLEEYHRTVTIRVECYAGYRAEQEPCAFWCGERRLEVRAIVDRWFAPTQRWFKVDAEDGDVYILRHDEPSGEWDIAAYRAGKIS